MKRLKIFLKGQHKMTISTGGKEIPKTTSVLERIAHEGGRLTDTGYGAECGTGQEMEPSQAVKISVTRTMHVLVELWVLLLIIGIKC